MRWYPAWHKGELCAVLAHEHNSARCRGGRGLRTHISGVRAYWPAALIPRVFSAIVECVETLVKSLPVPNHTSAQLFRRRHEPISHKLVECRWANTDIRGGLHP